MSVPNAVEKDMGSTGRIPNSDESVTLGDTTEDGPSEGKEEGEIEAGPVTSTFDADDYPDGGLAAWSVVLGVSPLTIPSSFGVY